MSVIEQPPLHLTILRKGDTHLIDLAEVGSLIPRSETQVEETFLRELVDEVTHLVTPGYGRRDGVDMASLLTSPQSGSVVQDLQRVGGLIFSHLLTEPARQRLRTAEPCDLYLRLDEQLIHVPWELCYDGADFLATKFRVGRQVITGAAIPKAAPELAKKETLKVLLVADPTESLPEAGHEAELLCALLDQAPRVDVTLLGGKQVRKIPLLAALQTHDVVHFAGHSHYDPDNPGRSGWRLYEGVLTASELSKLTRPPRLVFSNSCQAGATAEWRVGARYEGQAFGIGSAFLLAGVQNYIGTFWVVYDDESVLFATTFYQSLLGGRSLGGALLSARHEILKQKGWQGLTWASYMLYGDPTSTLLPRAMGSCSTLHSLRQLPSCRRRKKSLGKTYAAQGWIWFPPKIFLQPSRRRFLLTGAAALGLLVPSYFFFQQSSFFPDNKPRVDEQPSQPTRATFAPRKGESSHSPVADRRPQAVGVMHFKALSPDPQLEWMKEAIRDSFNSQLSNAVALKVYSKEYIDFLVQKGAATELEVANQLGIVKMISGSFLAMEQILRIEAHIVDVESGVLEASDSVEGEPGDFFNLHKRLATKIMARLNIAVEPEEKAGEAAAAPATPSLDTYKLLLEAEGMTPVPVQKDEPLSRIFSALVVDERRVGSDAPQSRELPEQEIRQVLERYRQAYEKKDLALLDSIYDMLSPAQREANAKYFQQTQNLQVTIRDVDIAVLGDEAAISYTREDHFIDARTGKEVKFAVRFTKFLVRLADAWKIASGKKEQWTPVKE